MTGCRISETAHWHGLRLALLVALIPFLPLSGIALAQNVAVFPGRPATDKDLPPVVKQAETTLTQPVGPADFLLPVDTAKRFPAPAVVSIDDEDIKICTLASGTIGVCPQGRGFGGTVAAPHPAGTVVREHVTPWQYNQLAAEVEAVESKLFNTIYVTDFGADRTGAKDSTAAINAAIAAAQERHAKIVRFPYGIYSVCPVAGQAAITVFSDLHLEGDGTASFGPGKPGTTIQVKVGCDGDLFKSWTYRQPAEWPHGAQISDMLIMGAPGQRSGSAINFWRTGEDTLFRDLVIMNFPGDGIRLEDNLAPCTIERVHVTGNKYGFHFVNPVGPCNMIAPSGDNNQRYIQIDNATTNPANSGYSFTLLISSLKAEATLPGKHAPLIGATNLNSGAIVIQGGFTYNLNGATDPNLTLVDITGTTGHVIVEGMEIADYHFAVWDHVLQQRYPTVVNSASGGYRRTGLILHNYQSFFGAGLDWDDGTRRLEIKGNDHTAPEVRLESATGAPAIRLYSGDAGANPMIAFGANAVPSSLCFGKIPAGNADGAVVAKSCIDDQGGYVAGSVKFAELDKATNGTYLYCTDCEVPSSGIGVCGLSRGAGGAAAFRIRDQWICMGR